MSLKAHCDRCDALCDEHQTWVEDGKLCAELFVKHPDVYGPNATKYICTMPFGHNSLKEPHSETAGDFNAQHFWYIVIHAGDPLTEEKMFCRACRIAILEAYMKGLKNEKTIG